MSRMSFNVNQLSQRYVEPLLAGDRRACRRVIDETLDSGVPALDLLTQLVWPVMERLQEFYRDDKISISSLNMATRLNRSITDQLCGRLPVTEPKGKRVLIF